MALGSGHKAALGADYQHAKLRTASYLPIPFTIVTDYWNPQTFQIDKNSCQFALYLEALWVCKYGTVAEKNCVPSLSWWLRKGPATHWGQPHRRILSSVSLPLASYNQVSYLLLRLDGQHRWFVCVCGFITGLPLSSFRPLWAMAFCYQEVGIKHGSKDSKVPQAKTVC